MIHVKCENLFSWKIKKAIANSLSVYFVISLLSQRVIFAFCYQWLASNLLPSNSDMTPKGDRVHLVRPILEKTTLSKLFKTSLTELAPQKWYPFSLKKDSLDF